jgi:hypothetical protein
MKITSTGGNILIRTCVITENGNDGIEISGAAHGVRIPGNIIGLDTEGKTPMGNKNTGVEIDGDAHDILLGGPQPTFNIIPHNVISANGGDGVAIDGHAHDVRVNFSDIGTDLLGLYALGNAGAGVLLGPGTHSIAVGSPDPTLPTVISGNQGDGVAIVGSDGNTVVGCLIGTDVLGSLPMGNGGNGVFISGSDNAIGGTAADVIAFNSGNGVLVASGSRNGIRADSIYGNGLLGIDLLPGANRNQAAPVLASVVRMPPGIQVFGTLTSSANTTFTIDFFENDTSAPSGRFFLGSLKVRTDGASHAAFTFFGPLSRAGGRFVTATATDPTNNTSEFSAPVS